jgi:hypothetical protein
MDPFTGDSLPKSLHVGHNGWVEERVNNESFQGIETMDEDFFIKDVKVLRMGDLKLVLESTQWDQWTEEEEITFYASQRYGHGPLGKVEFTGYHSYVCNGRSLYTCPQGRAKMFTQYEIPSGKMIRQIKLPDDLLEKKTSFGYAAWTVTQGCIVAVADGWIWCHQIQPGTGQIPMWERYQMEGRHKYASVSSNEKVCYILSGGSLYSLYLH